MTRFKERLVREEGFTLIELLVVVAIIGILLAIAVPSYLGFKTAAAKRAAAADVRSAIPSAEQYYADHQSSYLNMDKSALNGYDSGLGAGVDVKNATATSYCLEATNNQQTAHIVRPTPGTMIEGSLCS